jgi:hypothetical protein
VAILNAPFLAVIVSKTELWVGPRGITRAWGECAST